MTEFSPVIDLSKLSSKTGVKMIGAMEGDHVGRSVSAAGDVNGDGIDDLIVGAPSAGVGGNAYVVFGRAGGFGATLALSSLDGKNGFKLAGMAADDESGFSVSSAGDVNGDGFDDLIVGARSAGLGGSSYVVFGKSGGFGATLALSSLDGKNGFKLAGMAADDESGYSVSSAGDVNGDGFDDIIVGAPGVDVNGSASGAAYVVLGQATGFDPTLNLGSLDGSDGFRLISSGELDHAGCSVSSAGDVNGDGLDDIFVGAYNSGGAGYVVFGKKAAFGSTLVLNDLDGTNGFAVVGDFDLAGFSVSSAGDMNGDGFADIIVGAYGSDPNSDFSGTSYVVFGKASGFGATLNLPGLNGSNGFAIQGEALLDQSGFSVWSAGDVNGDGFDDVIVGAPGADPEGAYSGSSYVVFGKAGGFGATLALSSLDGTNGFEIIGRLPNDQSGHCVSSAGDVNGDGFDDIIIGAFAADPHGAESGSTYVVFGKAGGFTPIVKLGALDGRDGFSIEGIVHAGDKPGHRSAGMMPSAAE